MKKSFLIIVIAITSSCVSQTKYNEVLKQYNEALQRISVLEAENDEILNGEERLFNIFTSAISKRDYIAADQAFTKLIEKHPNSPLINSIRKNNPGAFKAIEHIKDSIAKAQRDSIRL